MKRTMAQYLSAYQTIAHAEKGEAVKIAILRSFSCEPLEQTLTVDLYETLNMRPSFYRGGFNQYAQEILNADSGLYTYKPDYVFLLALIEDICAEVFERYYNITNLGEYIDNAVDEYIGIIGTLQKRIGGDVAICNFSLPYYMQNTSYHAQSPNGVGNLVARANLRLSEKLSKNNAYILDINETIRIIGVEQAYDPKMFMLAGNPYAFTTYAALSRSAASLISSILGRRKKCIVLDLDNTLWKGIVGEGGVGEGEDNGDDANDTDSGIEISEPYRQMQKQLLQWNDSGILLAICSKNNYNDAIKIIREHPGMILREENFAALRINWDNKTDNIISIANELNIGIDSMIFIDDSAYECGLVAKALPEDEVIQLDGNTAAYAEIVKNIRSLDFVRLTEADRSRTAEYKAQNHRAELKACSYDIESYLRSLNMTVKIDFVNQFTIARAAQMTQKTNQFNLTTKRYTVVQLQQLLDKGYLILTLESSDRFGDNGIVGLMILNTEFANEGIWEIDTFLLSCRVIGRELERAFLSVIIKFADECNIDILIGNYSPTEKNELVRDLYEKCRFIYESGKWVFDVKLGFNVPSYFDIKFPLMSSSRLL